jgi:putative FmdB family regulatory protein
MRLYEFECLHCGFEFEALVQRASEKARVKCPACDSLKLEEKNPKLRFKLQVRQLCAERWLKPAALNGREP